MISITSNLLADMTPLLWRLEIAIPLSPRHVHHKHLPMLLHFRAFVTLQLIGAIPRKFYFSSNVKSINYLLKPPYNVAIN